MTDSCWLCLGLGGIAPHLKWSQQRGKPLWTAHEHPSDDPHPTYPCPVCSTAGSLTAAEVKVLTAKAGEFGYQLGRKEAYDREHMIDILHAEWLKHAEEKTVDSPRGHCERLVDALIAARDISKGDPA